MVAINLLPHIKPATKIDAGLMLTSFMNYVQVILLFQSDHESESSAAHCIQKVLNSCCFANKSSDCLDEGIIIVIRV